MKKALSKILIPAASDARWPLLVLMSSLAVHALATPEFPRSMAQFLTTMFATLGLECAILFWKGLPLFPLSAMITALGVFMFAEADAVWIYGVVSAIAIFSKHLIKVRGHHVFNPSNFGLVVALLLLPNDLTSYQAGWVGSANWSIYFFIFGLFVVWRARRLPLVMSFILVLCLCMATNAWLSNQSLLLAGGNIMGMPYLIYFFYLLPDPATTPSSSKAQILFGMSVALIAFYLHVHKVVFGRYEALFVISALYSLVRSEFPARGATPK